MANQANIVVFDGAATPVSHTFIPIGSKAVAGEDVALWRENLAAVPTYACPTIEMRSRKLKSGITRQAVTVSVPVMEAVGAQNAAGYTAPPKVAYVDSYSAVQYYDQRSTLTSKRLAKQILTNLLGNVSVTAPAIAAGPVSELFDSAIFPN